MRAPQLLEEQVQRRLLAALADPGDLAAVVAVDDGQVLLLATAVADLVHADPAQPAYLRPSASVTSRFTIV